MLKSQYIHYLVTIFSFSVHEVTAHIRSSNL